MGHADRRFARGTCRHEVVEAHWMWWLALIAAILLLAAPAAGVIRRAGARELPLFSWSRAVRPPWWTYAFSILGIPLLFVAARGLGDGEAGPWGYLFGGAVGALLLQAALIHGHNRRAARL
jgi:hypothetical protein